MRSKYKQKIDDQALAKTREKTERVLMAKLPQLMNHGWMAKKGFGANAEHAQIPRPTRQIARATL